MFSLQAINRFVVSRNRIDRVVEQNTLVNNYVKFSFGNNPRILFAI